MKRILVIAMVLAVVAALAMPLTALAGVAVGGATTINGSVSSVAELTAPNAAGALNLGTFVVGSNGPFNATDGSVTDNNPAGYYVRVSSNIADGKMQSTTGTTTSKLGSPLSVTTGSLSAGTVGTSGQTCVFSNVPASLSIPLSVSQAITNTDAFGSYSIVLTYTLTENQN